MEKLLPSQFTELLGGVALTFGILLTCIGLIPRIRTTAIRLAAILYLTTFALFANHWSTYFAAVFIVATAVTELEFLHILAAIIRGDKNYFDFRREYLTRDEVLRRAEDGTEPETAAGTTAEDDTERKPVQLPRDFGDLSHQRRMHFAFQIEQAALEWLQMDLGRPVERYVRFSSEAGYVELDGVVQGTRRQKDLVAEVKWIRDERVAVPMLHHTIPRLIELGHRYKSITNRDCEILLLLAAPAMDTIKDRALERARNRLQEAGTDFRIIVVTYEQLGIEIATDAA